jgi:hypothetical protein
VLAFAAQTDRSFYLRGVSLRPPLERIDDDTEVRSQPLPDEATWNTACARARTLFGLTPSLVRKAATVAALADDLRSKAEAAQPPTAGLLTELRSRMGEFRRRSRYGISDENPAVRRGVTGIACLGIGPAGGRGCFGWRRSGHQ